jgi:GGDEF domain-containing protein
VLLGRLEEGRRALNDRSDRPYKIEFSVGTAASADAAGCTLEQLIAEADTSMYAAKRERRRQG